MSTSTKSISAEELFEMGDIGRCELINGEIIHMAPAGAEHGEIAFEIGYRIRRFLEGTKPGVLFAAETGFIITRKPDTTRAPDLAFVRKERLPAGPLRGFFPGAPDLAVEVVSPSDRLSEVSAKVQQWLGAGATSVWLVDPPNRTIDVFGEGGKVIRFQDNDELVDEPMLPGFSLKLNELFDPAR